MKMTNGERTVITQPEGDIVGHNGNDARNDEEGPAAYDWDQPMEFEYLLSMPLSSLTTDRIEELQRNSRKTQSKSEVHCHTPYDLYGTL